MDSLLDIVYGDLEDDEFVLEDLVGNQVIVKIIKNKRFLNIDYFESIDVCGEEELEEIDEDELELGLEDEEIDIDDELTDFM
ncbi:hypothetical protein JY742_18460 [Clostridioides difficile]|nr:hypothetical protein [Clostridioides difficile]